MAGRSIREWTSDLNVQLRDTSGSQQVWSFQEKYTALQEGFRRAKGLFQTEDVYTSLTLVAGIREYAIPEYIEHIRLIERNNVINVNPGMSSVQITWSALYAWKVVASAETQRLWIDGEYPGAGTRIYYERDIPIPPVEATLWTNVNSTQGFIPVANTTPFQVWNWQTPFYAVVENEVVRVDAVTATSFTGVMRGMFNTTPQVNSLAQGMGYSHSSNMAITPYPIVPDNGQLVQYINNVARQQLYLYRLNDQDSEGNRNVAALATEWGRQAEETRKLGGSFHMGGRVMNTKFPRRK